MGGDVQRMTIAIHNTDIWNDLALVIAGLAVMTVGIWRLQTMPPRVGRMVGSLVCVCGIIPITVVAGRSPVNWGLRIVIFGMYSSAAVLFGLIIGMVAMKRHSGAVVARIGTRVSTGFRVVSAIAVSAGLVSVAMRANDCKPDTLLLLVGQGLFFVAFGMYAVVRGGGDR